MTFDELIAQVRRNAGSWYVYVLVEQCVPIYVGVSRARGGRRERLQDHKWHSDSVCRGVIQRGQAHFVIDSWHSKKTDAFFREVGLIAQLGRVADGSGTLLNVAAGGVGHSARHSDSARLKISAAVRGSYSDPDRYARQCEHLERARSSTCTDSALWKRSEASRRRWSREGERDRQRSKMLAAWQRQELREHWSRKSREAMKRPGVKERAIAVLANANRLRPRHTAHYRQVCRELARANGLAGAELPHSSAGVSIWSACATYLGAP